jgi:hypothetical protein
MSIIFIVLLLVLAAIPVFFVLKLVLIIGVGGIATLVGHIRARYRAKYPITRSELYNMIREYARRKQ